MFTPTYKEKFKTKVEAIAHIIEALIENPNTAGANGKLDVLAFGQYMQLTPVKKKK
jgi:hypothetical protein